MYDRKMKDAKKKAKVKEPFSIKDTFHQLDALKKQAKKKGRRQ